jgi:hypothetical protein
MGGLRDALTRRVLIRRAGRAGLFSDAWVKLCIVTLALRWLGFRGTLRWLPAAPLRPVTRDEIVLARGHAAVVDRAARIQPLPARCLARSLALHWLLGREGLPSALKIGVAKDAGALVAHAWVELAGVPVNATPAEVAPFVALAGLETVSSAPGVGTAGTESRNDVEQAPDGLRRRAAREGDRWAASGRLA